MTNKIGIMQGRLSPRPAGKLQEFPHGNWQQEFAVAARLGLDSIEWIFEAERHSENPLSSREGRRQIREVARERGVAVRSVCADYFMVHRLAGEASDTLSSNVNALFGLIEATHDIGAERILIPLLETSAVDTPRLREEVVQSLRKAALVAARYGIVLGIEMEIPGPEYAALVRRVGHPAVRAYYDIGNSTARGQDVARDVLPMLECLYAVHVKDRVRAGGSVQLGTGDANFAGFFAATAGAHFAGDIVLQHYFDLDPEGAARHALRFVRELLAASQVVP